MMKISNVLTFVVYLVFFWLVVFEKAYTTFSTGLMDDGMDRVAAGDFAVIATMIVFGMGLVIIYALPKYFSKGE